MCLSVPNGLYLAWQLRQTQYEILDLALTSNSMRLVVSHTTHRRAASGPADPAANKAQHTPGIEYLRAVFGYEATGIYLL